MAVLSSNNPTLVDLVDRMGSSGSIVRDIVEVLAERNEMLDDITFVEANGVTEHTTTIRTGYPSVAWRRFNYGVQPSKSTVKQVKDSLGMLEAYAEVDKKLAELNGNKEAWRATENNGFLEAMSQKVQRALIFGDNSKQPESINGLAVRFPTGVRTKGENAVNVLNAGGTGDDLTSIWLVAWSPETAFCLYPKGSQAGLREEDLGEHTATDADGGYYQVLRSHFQWDLGLCIRDWRYVVRIANISMGGLKKDPDVDGGPNIIDLMTEAVERLPMVKGRVAFYCNRGIRTKLRQQIRYAKNVHISMDEVAGRKVLAFDGIPVRTVDALAPGEKAVAF